MVAEKMKKARIEEEDEHRCDPKLVASLAKLQEIQEQLEKIDEDQSNEVLELEKKCEEVRRPVYSKRERIINSIPSFWSIAFMCHPALGGLVSEKDEMVFKHLASLDVEDDANTGYSITFNFSPNPYFENLKLTKSFSYEKGGNGTNIKWKEGMGLANGLAHKKKGNKRSHTEQSFFSWFDADNSNEFPDMYDEVAVMIKEDLWPNPLRYFNNDFEEDDDEVDDDDDDEENKTDEDKTEDDDGGDD